MPAGSGGILCVVEGVCWILLILSLSLLVLLTHRSLFRNCPVAVYAPRICYHNPGPQILKP